MTGAGNQHCANCIGTLSFPTPILLSLIRMRSLNRQFFFAASCIPKPGLLHIPCSVLLFLFLFELSNVLLVLMAYKSTTIPPKFNTKKDVLLFQSNATIGMLLQ